MAARAVFRRIFLPLKPNFVITGFNTDIEYEGVTYHVQTEDKGLARPIILSLVYNRGTILASKRSPYDDLLSSNFSERVLAERLNKQHRLICAAIQAGRIEDLKKMTAREAAAAKPPPRPTPADAPQLQTQVSPPAPQPVPAAEPAPVPAPSLGGSFRNEIVPPKPVSISLDDFDSRTNPIPKPAFDSQPELDTLGLMDEPIIEAVAIIDDEDLLVLPDDAVAIIEEPIVPERPGHNKLAVEILGNVRFKGGERNTVGFLVSRGSAHKVVAGAQIMVKILGSSFRPVIFHSSTDANGVATVNVQMPSFTSGRAAFLVRAISDGEEVELRRSIEHG